MSNNVFHFKQFSIHQARSAMKVSADAVLFGAWIPNGNYERIFDIGTGTGLLSLMCAQRFTEAAIDTTEINEGAYADACENIQSSPWHSRINAFNADARSMLQLTLEDETGKKISVGAFYDLIICNPPFFTSSLPAENAQRNIARHDNNLSAGDIFKLASQYLKQDGMLCVMYPAQRLTEIKNTAMLESFYLQKLTLVYSKPNTQPRLVFMAFTRNAPKTLEEELVICDSNNVHTAVYNGMVQPFYMFMD